jgi:tetratricopeptide (TPR) repeat protein
MRAVLLSLFFACTSVAEDDWVGLKLMPKVGAVYMDDNGVLPGDKFTLPLVVAAERGEWLEVGPGRIQKSDVVLLSDSPAYYTAHLQMDPTSVWAYSYRGVAWVHLKNSDNALDDFTEAIRLDPKFWSAYNNRGLIWQNKGNLDNAINDFNESLKIDQTNPFTYNNRGHVWHAKREFDKAIEDFSEAIRLNPHSALSYNGRGMSWMNKREADKALTDYTEAIRLDSKQSRFYYNRAHVWIQKGMYTDALKGMTDAISRDPNYALAYQSRAAIYSISPDENCRDGKLAVDDAIKALDLAGWQSAPMLTTLAGAYAECGEFDKAVEYQKDALNLASEQQKNGYSLLLELYRLKKPYRERAPPPSSR